MGTFIKEKELLAETGAFGFPVSVEKVERRKFATVTCADESHATSLATRIMSVYPKSDTFVSGSTVRVHLESRGRTLGTKNK